MPRFKRQRSEYFWCEDHKREYKRRQKWEQQKVIYLILRRYTGVPALFKLVCGYIFNLNLRMTQKVFNFKTKLEEYDDEHDGYGPIEEWNTSQITSMKNAFSMNVEFNRDISRWDVSNVRDMTGMFSYAHEFNQDLSQWDVTNVELMSIMFYQCYRLDQDFSQWNVGNVKNMMGMFGKCSNLCTDLSNWNIYSNREFSKMFYCCDNFPRIYAPWNLDHVASSSKYKMFSD